MTTLAVEVLATRLEQEIRINNPERYHIAAVIPYLYIHNPVADNFTLSIEKNAVEIFSQDFTLADVKSALSTTNNYAHVFYPIIPENKLILEAGLYSFILTATNYMQSFASYIGWVKQHENRQNEMDYTPINESQNSFSIRFKTYKEGIS